jgi:hypothetical protein
MFKQPEWGGGYYSGQPCQEVQNFAETHFFLDVADPKEGQSAQSLWNLDLRTPYSSIYCRSVASGHQGTGGTETLIPALACNITCKESSSVCGEWPDFNDKAKK